MRIYTLTANPALDLSGHVKRLVANEKNYVFAQRRDPGGNGINAARVAHRLGAKVVALGFAGGSTGDEIEVMLKKEGVRTDFTRIAAQTRTNITVTNEFDHQQTRLTFPGPQVTPKEVRKLFETIKQLKGPGIFILGGSIPAGCREDFPMRVARIASERGLGVIADVPSKFLRQLLKSSDARFLLLKPNKTELEEALGRSLRSDQAIADAAMRIAARRSKLVCVSLAERGAILATESKAWFGVAPKVRAKGSVGAGDSMVGAMAARLLSSQVVEDVFRWGLAAGAATAEVSGTTLARAVEVRRLVGRVKIREL